MSATKREMDVYALREENGLLIAENRKLREIIRKISDFVIKLPDDADEREALREAIEKRMEAIDCETKRDLPEHARHDSGA